MRMDFLMSGHFFGASERGSGRHKVTLWRPEKMAAREKDTADAEIFGARLWRALAVRKIKEGEQTRIHFGFATFFRSAHGE